MFEGMRITSSICLPENCFYILLLHLPHWLNAAGRKLHERRSQVDEKKCERHRQKPDQKGLGWTRDASM
eukprot:scaffold38627_cov161-Skeletonema_dohrnii-CCMP3373.AAC.2